VLTLVHVEVDTPRSLVLDPPLTDPEFEALCAANDLVYFERTREGENGVALGWLIDPYNKRVQVYEPGREAVAVSGKRVQGSGPVEGFSLDLDQVWRCYEI
jgi:hypothetical protein